MSLLSQKNFSTLSDFGAWKCYYFWTVLLVLAEMFFWIANGWILWLLLVYDVLWYEVHIPLVIFGGVLIAVALGF